MFKHPFKNNSAALAGFQNIQKKLNQQRKLLRLVKASLNDNVASHCLHINSSSKSITLFTDSSIWASKLLYLRPTILAALSTHFGEQIHTLKIKVLTKQVKPTLTFPKPPSDTAIKSLSATKDTQTSDKLNISMNKLIKTLKRNKLLN